MLRIIKALFNHAINIMVFDFKNTCQGLQPFPVDSKLKYIPSDYEINQLLSICDIGQQTLIKFVMETGCRINEALNLKWADVNKTHIVLYTRKSRYGNLTPRKLPIPACMSGIPTNSDKTEKVFYRWTKQPRFLDKKLKKAEMKV